MHERAYGAQCASTRRHAQSGTKQTQALALFALAVGSFAIGTSEFASMGVLQLFAADLGLSVPQATNAITAYAIGVVIGAPLVTLGASRLNRKTLLICLMALFAAGNLLSSIAINLPTLIIARFIAGLPQGGYFGASAVVASYIFGPGKDGRAFALVMTGLTIATIIGSPIATFLGQALGWRDAYLIICVVAVVALRALWVWTPNTKALDGGPLKRELGALRRASVWGVMIVAAIGVGSIFAVYTFIGPFLTDVDHVSRSFIPVGLALFGFGMAMGNLLGGRLADHYPNQGVIFGFGTALVILAILAIGGGKIGVLLPCLFGVGASMMTAIPTIQVHLAHFAPEAPTLMGAMNLASLNVANGIGACAGGVSISLGFGLLSPAWAGFACTLLGLLIFVITLNFSTKPSV